MATSYSITEYFGKNLAEKLADKIVKVYPDFETGSFISRIDSLVAEKTYTQRIGIIAQQLKQHLPNNYEESVNILLEILGEENLNETGMFKHFYWIMPVGKFISLYGHGNFILSMKAIEEITKRNTGEYAVRPFIEKYPNESLKKIKEWACSPNFHLRRLASEGLRPKLPWAPKLDLFINNPEPVFEILEILKEDNVMFVKKSVANHLTDWIKVNRGAAFKLIESWQSSKNINTQWIIKKSVRKL